VQEKMFWVNDVIGMKPYRLLTMEDIRANNHYNYMLLRRAAEAPDDLLTDYGITYDYPE
jgi:hypothetical protein